MDKMDSQNPQKVNPQMFESQLMPLWYYKLHRNRKDNSY